MSEQKILMDELKAAYRRAEAKLGTNPPLSSIMLELTRPQQQFREGQVLHHSYLEDDQPTGEYVAIDGVDLDCYGPSWRKLTQSEVGDDWYPKEAVEALRRAMEVQASSSRFQGIGSAVSAVSIIDDFNDRASKALAAFDKATNRNQFEDYVAPFGQERVSDFWNRRTPDREET